MGNINNNDFLSLQIVFPSFHIYAIFLTTKALIGWKEWK